MVWFFFSVLFLFSPSLQAVQEPAFCEALAERSLIKIYKFTAEEKKALLVAAAIETDCPLSPGAIHSITLLKSKLRPWKREFTVCEALQAAERLFYLSIAEAANQSRLSRYRLTPEGILRSLIYVALAKQYAQKTVEFLREQQFIAEPGRVQKIRLALHQNPVPVQVANLAFNSGVFYYLGVPLAALLALPVLAVSGSGVLSYFEVPKEALELADYSLRHPLPYEDGGDPSTQDAMNRAVALTKEKFQVWGKFDLSKLDVALSGANQLYSAAFKVLMIYVFVKVIPWIQFAYSSAHLTRENMQQYEQAHYDPVKVVDEELQSWLESFDEQPSVEAIAKKRKELEEMEKRGVFKIYIKDPAKDPAPLK